MILLNLSEYKCERKQMRQKLIAFWIVSVFVMSAILASCGDSTPTQNTLTLTTTPVTTTQQTTILTSETSSPTQNLTTTTTTRASTTQTTLTRTLPTYTTTVTPSQPSFVVIAASDSSNQWKSLAVVTCDGTADQIEINTWLATGNTVELAAGSFQCNSTIKPQTNTHLYGQGDTTILNFTGGGIQVSNKDNVELDHFKITGTTNPRIIPTFIYIEVTTGNHHGFSMHDIKADKGGFLVYTYGHQITDVVFNNCDSINPGSTGFSMYAEGTSTLMQDFIFYNCSVVNNIVTPKGADNWSTGFDFAEGDNNLTVNRLTVINCSVNGAWESDFHFESAPIETGIVILDCVARNAGQKPSPTYGFGYLLPSSPGDEYIFYGNAGGNNAGRADVYDASSGHFHTLPYDAVYGSAKLVSRITQNNCSGIMVTNGSYLDLFLYSNNANPVNQQIELGSIYMANDGTIYTFDGSTITVQFTDFAVIRLVKRG